MDQPTFADLEYESKKRKTRREIFLERMVEERIRPSYPKAHALIPWEQMEERIRPSYPKAGRGRPYELSAMVRIHALIPWEQMEERIRPSYPKAGRGRRPYELSAMVRIHCVQLFYNLSDPGMTCSTRSSR